MLITYTRFFRSFGRLNIKFPYTVPIALYHNSSIQLGRRTGASALEADPRPFSKKQKQRKRLEAEARESRRDPRKEKFKERSMTRQLESPELASYVEDLEHGMDDVVKGMLLPEGIAEYADSGAYNLVREKSMYPPLLLSLLEKQVTPEDTSGLLSASKEISSPTQITFDMAQKAIAAFAKRGNLKDSEKLLSLMQMANFELNSKCFTHAMVAASRCNQFKKAEELFNAMIAKNIEPDEYAWSALVHAKAKGGDYEGALQVINRLQKSGVKLHSPSVMYTSILAALVDVKKYDEATKIWIRMHNEGIVIGKEAFNVMLKLCARTSTTERAFFYIDEMQALGVQPDANTFAALFRACAEAPQWVNGYQHIVFDAMSRMEGAEMIPTTEVYNSIIHAFARAGDAVAAEFYFWEMRRKGLRQDLITYRSLLGAYAKSQLVGCREYGLRGRYVRKEEVLSEDDKVQAKLGPARHAAIMSEELWSDNDTEKSKRARANPIQDDAEDPIVQEVMWAKMVQEAAAISDTESRTGGTRDAGDAEQSSMGRGRLRGGGGGGKSVGDVGTWNRPSALALTHEAEVDSEADSELSVDADVDQPDARDVFAGLSLEEQQEMEELIKQLNGIGIGAIANSTTTEDDKLVESEASSSLSANDSEPSKFVGTGSADSLTGEEGVGEEAEVEAEVEAAAESVGRGRERTRTRRRISAWRPGRRDSTVDRSSDQPDWHSASDALSSDDSSSSSTFSSSDALQQLHHRRVYPITDSVDNAVQSRLSKDQSGASKADEDSPSFLKLMLRGQRAPPPSRRPIPAVPPVPVTSSAQKEAISLLDGQGEEISTLTGTAKGRRQQEELQQAIWREGSEITRERLDASWDMITFGRAPDPDYSVHWRQRQEENIISAEGAMTELRNSGLVIDIHTMTMYMAVFADALRVDEALRIFESLTERGLSPTPHTYRVLIRMYVRSKDVKSALALKDEMKNKDLLPDAQTFGLLIQTLSHRDMIVEALQLLEEAHDQGISIAERHMTLLRGRCNNLGIDHPNMTPDPVKWVKDLKEVRRARRNAPQRKIQAIKGKLFN